MTNSRGKILWVDDEIDHLKPHILFLEDKGFSISTATNGADAVIMIKENNFQLILMDQFMPGQDGIQTIEEFNEIRPNLPVIMITKSEEEWLMDEAISQKISQFLIKPVSPSQIFMACKQVIENFKIREEKITSGYLKEFQEIEESIRNNLDADEWWNIYNRLVKWQIDFEEQKEASLIQILNEQFLSCNRNFTKFVESEYVNWLSDKQRPILSPDIFKTKIKPILENDDKVCFVVVDAMRLDHFMELYSIMAEDFLIDIDSSISILPTATPFARNSIFSGLFPDKFCKKYPKQLEAMSLDKGSLNNMEGDFLRDQLIHYQLSKKSLHYYKIWYVEEGKKFLSKIREYLNNDLIAIVVNFVDQLAHRRSESDILKEMVPNESGYRLAVKIWYENSWLRDTLSKLAESGYKVVITSDHGSVMVNRGTIVAADKNSSSGIRYKYGRNINVSNKSAIDARDLHSYRLPKIGHQTNYLFAKEDFFFLYPNEQNKYKERLNNSFQHGGVSMEEMLIPIFTMTPK